MSKKITDENKKIHDHLFSNNYDFLDKTIFSENKLLQIANIISKYNFKKSNRLDDVHGNYNKHKS